MKPSSTISNILATEIDPAFARRAGIIVDAIQKQRPKRVLDAGCGRGFYIKLLTYFPFVKKIAGIDVNETYLEKAKKNIKNDKRVSLQTASIYTIPYPNDYFDAVICSEVLEHLTDDKKAIQELSRVIKKGGILIVTVPNLNFPFLWDPLNWLLMRLFNTHIPKHIWWLAGIWADHVRLYNRDEVINLLKPQFKIEIIKSVVRWCWPFSHFLLYGIGKNLVERGNVAFLSRFSVESKNRNIARFLANFMRLPTIFDKINDTVCVNHVIIAIK